MTVLTEPHVPRATSRAGGVDIALTNVRIVLDDDVIDDGTIEIRDGVIEAVGHSASAPPDAIDGGGLFCLAGLIDTHSDGLEKELRPRPNVVLPGRLRPAVVRVTGPGRGRDDRLPRRRLRERSEVRPLGPTGAHAV